MANIIDYIKWRGDISFDHAPFNEVDNLILSMLCYVDLDEAVTESFSDEITLKDAADILFKDNDVISSMLVINKKDFTELLKIASESKRFSNIRMTHFVNKLDSDIQMQFSAVTYILPNKEIYISFRGTDDTITGWQEDLNISVMDVIPSQQEALNYLIETGNKFSDSRIYIGGHSKGGNLAVYSGIKSPDEITDRIIQVYSNDGPGFMSSNISPDLYERLQNKIINIVPESSVVGMLMNHGEEYSVVKSSSNGLMQHNGFSWEVLGTEFIHKEKIDRKSKILDKSLSKSLEECSVEERKVIIQAVSTVLSSTEAKTLTDMSLDGFKAMTELVQGYDSLSKESRKTLNSFIQEIIKYAMQNAADSAKSAINTATDNAINNITMKPIKEPKSGFKLLNSQHEE